jgi:hypothetical protein
VITDDGLDKLRAASTTHVAQIEEFFAARLDPEQQYAAADMLERLCGQVVDETACGPPQADD